MNGIIYLLIYTQLTSLRNKSQAQQIQSDFGMMEMQNENDTQQDLCSGTTPVFITIGSQNHNQKLN